MPRPVHFEIHAADPARAQAFYELVFGWLFQQWGENPYWLIQTGDGPGIDGGMVPRRGPQPAPDAPVAAFPLTMDTTDLDATLKAVLAAGGTVVVPRSALPGVGYTAYCKDTEGNIFGLMQSDESAG